MDESQTTTPGVAPAVDQTQFQATAPVAAAEVPQEPKKSGSGGFLVMLLVVAILLTVVAAGAYYWYTTQVAVAPKTTSTQVLPTHTPVETLESLESEATNLQIEDLEQDFTAIDSDLGNL